MVAQRPVTDEERTRILELHAAGKGRNQIRREVGRSAAVVSQVVHEAGGTFDRTGQVAAATAAKQADNRAKRAQLMTDLLDDAQRLRESLWEPVVVYNFGGKDNTYEEQVHDEPDAASKLKLMQAVGVAIDRSLKIDEHDSGAGVDAARSMLTDLASKLGAAWRGDDPEPPCATD